MMAISIATMAVQSVFGPVKTAADGFIGSLVPGEVKDTGIALVAFLEAFIKEKFTHMTAMQLLQTAGVLKAFFNYASWFGSDFSSKKALVTHCLTSCSNAVNAEEKEKGGGDDNVISVFEAVAEWLEEVPE